MSTSDDNNTIHIDVKQVIPVIVDPVVDEDPTIEGNLNTFKGIVLQAIDDLRSTISFLKQEIEEKSF